MAAAAMRHKVHQVPMTMGWMMIKKMLTAPKGTIMIPNRITSQGMVRQRRLSPMIPVKISSI